VKQLALKKRVRSITRDLSDSIFRDVDVTDYINEGIDRVIQVLPMLAGMEHLTGDNDEPALLPKQYHHVLSVYSASRCYFQDERHYQASTLMNEFEVKMDELKTKIENGEITITDSNGDEVSLTYKVDYVTDNYFYDALDTSDNDDGVEGV
jgi:hypothetical protein